jgi:hypothetical protein
MGLLFLQQSRFFAAHVHPNLYYVYIFQNQKPAQMVDIVSDLCYYFVTVFMNDVSFWRNDVLSGRTHTASRPAKPSEVFHLAKSKELTYKGHPLRRKDNLIYFGSMAEKYIVMLQILESKKVNDLDVATRVSVQLQLTDPDLRSRDRVVKKAEKDGLYPAMDVATVWLERALAEK